jgi:hypothetical protein
LAYSGQSLKGKRLRLTPQSTAPLNAIEGDVYYDDGTSSAEGIYTYTNGQWQSIGSGESGINYITNSSFEAGTTDWTGDTNLVISKEVTTPLRGLGSLKIAKAAADASTEQVYIDFTIDTTDLAKKLVISFDKDFSSMAADGDFIVKIVKDPAGTPVEINVNGYELSADKNPLLATFQTDATELDYRLIIECVETGTSAYDLIIDNVQVGPRSFTTGAIQTDWQDFTPTTTWVTGVDTTKKSKWRQVGDSMEIVYDIILNGSPTATALKLDIPGGFSIDSSKFFTGLYGAAGTLSVYDQSVGTVYTGDVTVDASSTTQLLALARNTATLYQATVTASFPITFVSTDSVTLTAKVPIQGWSSNARMSEDLGQREVVVEGAGNGGTSITADVTDIDFTETRDTTASWNGTQFDTPESGDYQVEGSFSVVTASPNIGIVPYVNGTTTSRFFGFVSASDNRCKFSGTIRLEKGQLLSLRSATTNTLVNTAIEHHIFIKKLASPQAFFESETVAARYTSTNGQAVADTATIIYETNDGDTHNAFSSGVYTVPVSGWYDIVATIRSDSNNKVIQIIQGASTVLNTSYNAAADSSSVSVHAKKEFTKGDTIKIINNSGGSRTLTTQAGYNTFSIARIK